MLNSGLCDAGPGPSDVLALAGFDRSAAAGASARTPREVRRVSQEFAAVFYSVVVRQMQRGPHQEQEEGSVSEGVRGLFGMFLPRALVRSPSDPLTDCIYEQLGARQGEMLDETG
jgi:Rod binding domain-containing protein